MKKIISILSALLLVSAIITAEEITAPAEAEPEFIPSEKYLEIQQLIDDDLENNLDRISLMTQAISEEEKEHLYNENSVPYWPIALNAVGYGIGSYVQGDKKFAIPITILDGISSLSIGAGLVGYMIVGMGNMIVYFFSEKTPNFSESKPEAAIALNSLLFGGLACHGVLTAISIIRASVYPGIQNRILSDALNPKKNETPEFSFLPIFTPSEKSGIAPGFVCMMQF